MKIELKNSIAELGLLAEKTAEFTRSCGVTKRCAFAIQLICEELFTNIVSHGLLGLPEGEKITLSLEYKENRIRIRIIDAGPPFNIMERQTPDISSSVQQREIGGLGIHLVKSLAEKIEYTRNDDKNIHSIVIEVTGEGDEDCD